jgi:two-component system, cell cycle sensor histidine kinase and response regulator CckA
MTKSIPNILLADDNKQSQKLLSAILNIEGYQTYTAFDGKEAIDILGQEKIDLIISDVLMPNVDGYYLCFKIRTNPRLKDLPIIIYTATYTSESEEKLALEMGADLFIRKPAPSSVILESIVKMLGTKVVRSEMPARTEESFESMHQYSSDLISKLEQRNLELESSYEKQIKTLQQFEDAEMVARMGHWELNLTDNTVSWSATMHRLFGYDHNEIEPSQALFFEHVHPDDLEHVRTTALAAQTDFTKFGITHRIIQSGGDLRYLFTTGRTEFDANEKPLRMFGISMDITVMRENEIKLMRSNHELETFIYRAYHDLRSPILSIIGLVNLMTAEALTPSESKYSNLIGEVARRQNVMLTTLVNTMSVRGRKLAITSFMMTDLVGELERSARHVNGAEKVDIKFSDNTNCNVNSDRGMIVEIITHLIANSIQFADLGKQNPEVSITFSNNDSSLLIDVVDNGIGISKEVIGKVFDLFYRGTIVSKGSGLGLYLVKNIVERLHGKIDAVSNVGVDCSFKVELPLHVSQEQYPDERLEASNHPLSELR